MLATTISPKLRGIILGAFDLYAAEEQNVIREESRQRYANSLYKFFYEVLVRIDDSRFLDSFYDHISRLYVELDSNSVLATKLINLVLRKMDSDLEVKLEILYSGKKNSLDLILNYATNILSNSLRLAEIDSAKLLQLINFYSKYEFSPKPPLKQFSMADRPGILIRKRFAALHKQKVYAAAAAVVAAAEKINEAISDSEESTPSYALFPFVPEPVLRQSWGGEGVSLFNAAKDLDILGKFFGRTENSISGEMNLVGDFLRILKAGSFGAQSEFTDDFFISGTNFFGRFNQLFAASGESSESIWGLGFLKPLVNTRSFQSAHRTLDPVEYLFRNGIKDRLGEERIGRKETQDVLPLSIYANNLVKRAYKIGGHILSLKHSLDKNGRLKNYEGLGSIKYPLEALEKVFPVDLSCYQKSKMAGLIGALENLAAATASAQEHIYMGSFPGTTLEEIVPWIGDMKNRIETIAKSIETVGYKSGDIIPNIPLEVSGRNRSDFERYFKNFGYSQNKVEKILTSRSLGDLVGHFEDVMTSQDAKSFLHSYDLAKLVYSIAGEAGIEAVLEYMLAPDTSGLARVFNLLDIKRDQFLKIDQYKYGKLVGALYAMGKAADPNPIEKLIPLLRAKNSTIGQSLKIVSEFRLDYPVKETFEINILDVLIDQMAWGHNQSSPLMMDLSCKECLADAPASLREWIQTIDESAGSALKESLLGMLERRQGITYSELSELLRLGENYGFGVLGGITQSIRGGDFSAVLRGIYRSGLAVLMRPRKSATQPLNSVVRDQTDQALSGLVSNLGAFSTDLQLMAYRLLISSEDETLDRYDPETLNYDIIINLLNKPLKTYPRVIQALGPDSGGRLPYRYNRTILKQVLEQSEISEPPGIGNSPRVTREFGQSGLTPDIAALLEAPKVLPTAQSRELDAAVPMVKINLDSFSKERFSSIVPGWQKQRDAFSPVGSEAGTPQDLAADIGTAAEEYRDGNTLEPIFPTSISTPSFNPLSDYAVSLMPDDVVSPIRGSYYLSKDSDFRPRIESTALGKKKYDPVESCKKFGTSDSKCRELFKDYRPVECAEYLYNKSTLIQEDFLPPRPAGAKTIPLSRPLGTTGALNPSGAFLPNSYKALPYYLRGWTPISLAPNGEPLGIGLPSLDADGWDNSSLGLNAFLSENPMPVDEQECVRYDRTKDIQKCLNLLRCRRLSAELRPSYCTGVEF